MRIVSELGNKVSARDGMAVRHDNGWETVQINCAQLVRLLSGLLNVEVAHDFSMTVRVRENWNRHLRRREPLLGRGGPDIF